MSISTREFCIAMEIIGATKLNDRFYPKHTRYVPCFQVNGVDFIHGGDGFVVTVNHKIPRELLECAMAEFGEKYPEGYNFRWDEIHSVEGILTLCTMLKNCYSKELVQSFVDEIYYKIIEQSHAITNNHPHFHTSKMDLILSFVNAYDNIINPFGNATLKLKKPSQYMKDIKVFFSIPDEDTTIVRLKNLNTQTEFSKTLTEWHYSSMFWNTSNTSYDGGYTSVDHHFEISRKSKTISEYILLQYTSHDDYRDYPGDIFIKLDLKNAMTCKPYIEKEPHLATDEELDLIILHLQNTICRIKQDILKYLVRSTI